MMAAMMASPCHGRSRSRFPLVAMRMEVLWRPKTSGGSPPSNGGIPQNPRAVLILAEELCVCVSLPSTT